MIPLYTQDLHIHTIFSTGDSAVSREQTVELVAEINHAKIIGISDHFEYIGDENYKKYKESVTSFRFKLGTEVDGHKWVDSECFKIYCKRIGYSGKNFILGRIRHIIL